MGGGDTEAEPLTTEPSTPVEVQIDPKSFYKNFGKFAVGLAFILISAFASDYWTAAGWLILMFLGIFLILDLVILALPSSQIQIKVDQRTINFSINKEYTRLALIAFLGLLLMILACSIGPWHWVAGNTIALIVSILVLISVGVKLFWQMRGTEQNTGLSGSFLRQMGITEDVLAIVSSGWIGFSSNERCTKIISQNRLIFIILTIIIIALVSLTMIEEFILIKNWSCDLYADRWLYGGLGWGVDMRCNCVYWAGISASCTLIVLSLVFAGIYKPTWPLVFVAGTFSLGYGIYMNLLSTYTFQSLMFLGNITSDVTEHLPFDGRVNRFLHLVPIQYIGVILTVIGFSLLINCLDIKPVENRSKVVKVFICMLMLALVVLTVLNMTITQININDQVKKHWENGTNSYSHTTYFYIPWNINMAYTLYTASLMSTSMFLLIWALYNLVNRNMMIPGVISWWAGVSQFGLAIFSIYSIFHAAPYPGPDSVPELVILQETPTWILTINLVVILMSALLGICNLIYNSLAMMQFVVWVIALGALPFLPGFGLVQ